MKTQNMTTSLILFLFPLLLPYISLANEEPKRTPNCSVFQCGNIGINGFPFSNVTYPECGLYALDCYGETPLVKLEERWYQVTSIFYNNRKIVLRDPLLQDHLNSRNCSLNYDFTLPAFSPSISFVSKITTLTLYKCTADHPVSLSSSEFYNYTSCKDNYVLYYDYPSQLPSTLNENDTSYCSVIQLPLIERLLSQDYVRRDNLFDLLTADLSLEWNVSEDCFNCYSGKGQCITNKARQFECDKWENSTKLIINGGAKSNIKMKLQIGIGVGGTLVTVVLFILVIFQFRKIPSWKKENNNDQNLDFFFRNNGSFAPKRYRYMEVDKMTDSFKEKLGQGGCGSVFKGQLQDGRLVAVKVLFVKSTVNSGEAFLNEVASISRTSHINIVSLLGFCYEKDKRALIYEFMPNGSLDKFIYKKDILLQSSLEWEMLYQISIGIARGLGYLHRGCTTRIIHFDIKPHNILLDEDFSPKISDFGLAKLCPGKESIISMLDARGTIGYIAPEVFSRNFGGVSHKSDVYSYGMMVLEMVGGRKNFDVKVGKDHSSQLYFPDWIYDRLDQEEGLGLHGIMTEQKEEAAAKKMIIVGLWCIQINPSTRPSMSKVLEMLEGSLEALEIPPKPFLSSPARSSPSSTGSSILHDIK